MNQLNLSSYHILVVFLQQLLLLQYYTFSSSYQLCYSNHDKNGSHSNKDDINKITINNYIKNIIDKSWYEYISFVYEDSNNVLNNRYDYGINQQYHHSINSSNSSLSSSNIIELIKKSDINFYYQNAPIKIHPIDWPKSIPFLSKFGTHYRGAYVTSEKYPDNSWVEVSRFAIGYRNKDWSEGYCYFDGYRGFVYPVRNDKNRIGYGCWFHKAKGNK
jgi:hypothetical protein